LNRAEDPVNYPILVRFGIPYESLDGGGGIVDETFLRRIFCHRSYTNGLDFRLMYYNTILSWNIHLEF
jgi:hypothetical protein